MGGCPDVLQTSGFYCGADFLQKLRPAPHEGGPVPGPQPQPPQPPQLPQLPPGLFLDLFRPLPVSIPGCGLIVNLAVAASFRVVVWLVSVETHAISAEEGLLFIPWK